MDYVYNGKYHTFCGLLLDNCGSVHVVEQAVYHLSYCTAGTILILGCTLKCKPVYKSNRRENGLSYNWWQHIDIHVGFHRQLNAHNQDFHSTENESRSAK